MVAHLELSPICTPELELSQIMSLIWTDGSGKIPGCSEHLQFRPIEESGLLRSLCPSHSDQ